MDKIKALFCSKDYKTVAANLFTGMMVWQIAAVVSAIFDPIDTVTSAGNALQSFAESGSLSGGGVGFFDVVMPILNVAVLFGLVVFMLNLNQWSKLMTNPVDAKSVKNIWIGVILGLVAGVVDFIPLMGWAAGILYIAGFIMMLLGYNALKSSATFTGTEGAKKLFLSMIFAIVGAGLGIIPLIGGWFEMVLDIVAFVFMFLGWKAIKDAPAPQAAK